MTAQSSRSSYLAKVHRLDTFAAQRWSDGWCWRRLTRSDDELDQLIGCPLISRHLARLEQTCLRKASKRYYLVAFRNMEFVWLKPKYLMEILAAMSDVTAVFR